MRNVLTLILVAIALTVVGCSKQTTVGNRTVTSNQNAATSRTGTDAIYDPTPRPLEAPRISLEEAKKGFDAKTAVFIDTHSPEQFVKQHIPGAINIMVSELAAKENRIPKGKKIIAYCS